MIKTVNGDIFLTYGDILVHQVNCQGKIGYGIAGQIIDRYPIVEKSFKEFSKTYGTGKRCLGMVDLIFVGWGHNESIIANLYGQNQYGNSKKTGLCYTSYEDLELGLLKIESFARKNNLSVKIPYGMSCGLAGGSWNKVYGIIKHIFECSTVECTIFNK